VSVIRIVLAVEPPMLSELLRLCLEDEWDLAVVDEVFDPFDLLLSVAETDADVVVLTVSQPTKTPAICTHLFEEFPNLLTIGLCPETNLAYAYRDSGPTEQLSDVVIRDVVAAIRTADCRA
jgi:DNA-binding NarL/FixJ family response regulator